MVGVLLAAEDSHREGYPETIGAAATNGFTVALWANVVSLVTLEVTAAWRARMRAQDVWLQAAMGALTGLAIVALKLILH